MKVSELVESNRRDNFSIKHDPDGTPVKVYPPSNEPYSATGDIRTRMRNNIRAFGGRKKNRGAFRFSTPTK